MLGHFREKSGNPKAADRKGGQGARPREKEALLLARMPAPQAQRAEVV